MKNILRNFLTVFYSILIIFSMLLFSVGCDLLQQKPIEVKTVKIVGEDVIVVYADNTEKNLGPLTLEGINNNIDCTNENHVWESQSKIIYKTQEHFECEKIKIDLKSCLNCHEILIINATDLIEHRGGVSSCVEKAKCSICQKEYGDLDKHDYKTVKYDTENHWFECECGEIANKVKHLIVNNCCVCGYQVVDEHTHDYTALKFDGENHWRECSCGDKKDVEEHKGGNATCTEQATCETCGNKYGDLKDHQYNTLKKSGTQHWYECSCGAYETKENHKPGAAATETTDQTCTICGHIITPALGHVHTLHLTKVDAKPQSCTKEGNIEYYTCSCGKWFADNTATTEITDKSSVVIEKDEHSYTELKKSATEHWYECVCGAQSGIENHKGGTATCQVKANCSICNESYGNFAEHEYLTKKYNATQHWYECVCGDKSEIKNHYNDNAFCNDNQKCEECDINYISKKHKIGSIIIEENTPNTAYDLAFFKHLKQQYPDSIKFKNNVESLENLLCGTILEATFTCDLCQDQNPNGITIHIKINGQDPQHLISYNNTNHSFINGEIYKIDSNIMSLVDVGLLNILGGFDSNDLLSATKDKPIMLSNKNTDCCNEMLVIYVYNLE